MCLIVLHDWEGKVKKMAKLVTILFIYNFFKGLTAPYQVRWKVNSDFSDMVWVNRQWMVNYETSGQDEYTMELISKL